MGRLAPSRNLDAHQQRVEQLRRNRAASLSLRVAFPAVQELRLELKFLGATPNAPGYSPTYCILRPGHSSPSPVPTPTATDNTTSPTPSMRRWRTRRTGLKGCWIAAACAPASTTRNSLAC